MRLRDAAFALAFLAAPAVTDGDARFLGRESVTPAAHGVAELPRIHISSMRVRLQLVVALAVL